jgi:hypothetical protein
MWYGTGKGWKTYYPGSLNVAEFFEYMQNNGTKIPFKVNESRWKAMLKWFETRHQKKDWVINELTGNKE